MKKIRLEAVTSSGKIKFLELIADRVHLITRWGLVGSDKIQETKEKCEAKNVGKKNFISAEAQAILRLERKIKKKMDEGYDVPGAVHLVDKFPNLSALQKHFAPCKPIAKSPKDALSGKYLADRKYNGVNLIITKDKNGFGHIYTRRIDDITNNLENLPEFKKLIERIPRKSMLLIELIYVNDNRVEEPEHLRALINKRRSKEAVHDRYHKINKNGKIKLMVFDVMFWNGKNMCDEPFLKRRGVLDSMMSFNVPVAIKFTQKMIDLQKGKWEGFVLRKPDGKIVYTMNGKAKRFGSWKWKYEITEDFIVVDAEYGRGKHDGYFARFKLAQYNKNGDLVDCGYCGPGNLKVNELKEIHATRKALGGIYTVKPYMVIEVLFRARASGGVKLEFPVFKRIRDDKKPTECIYDG
jgi:DNA ligase-1